MAREDRQWNERENRGRGGRDLNQRWYGSGDEGRDDSSQWGRHQPRQGGDFEDRYQGRGGSEALGDERGQRGRWRGDSYGGGRYEHDDHLRSGGSYGGQYGERDEDRYYSPSEGRNERDLGRNRYSGSSQYGYGGREDRGYGYDQGPRQSGFSSGSSFGSDHGDREYRGSDWRERHSNEERYGQGYGSRAYENSDRYGGDYSLAGSGLTGQWDRGFGEMSRNTSSGYGQGDYGVRSSRGYGDQSSWSGGVNQPQRQSFRGKGPKGYERSDERLKEIICERLMEDPNIDASEISIDVRNREVTLQGTVEDRRVKYEVEELIESCGGVKDVKNQLRVRARSSESGDTTSPQAGANDYGTSGLSGISGSSAHGSGAGTTSTPSSGTRAR